jgi:hypothetical protein
VVRRLACSVKEDAARTRAANDLRCNEEKVTVESLGGNAYRTGCYGRSVTYVCAGKGVGITRIRERSQLHDDE